MWKVYDELLIIYVWFLKVLKWWLKFLLVDYENWYKSWLWKVIFLGNEEDKFI